jgi:hypothetical protein
MGKNMTIKRKLKKNANMEKKYMKRYKTQENH